MALCLPAAPDLSSPLAAARCAPPPPPSFTSFHVPRLPRRGRAQSSECQSQNVRKERKRRRDNAQEGRTDGGLRRLAASNAHTHTHTHSKLARSSPRLPHRGPHTRSSGRNAPPRATQRKKRRRQRELCGEPQHPQHKPDVLSNCWPPRERPQPPFLRRTLRGGRHRAALRSQGARNAEKVQTRRKMAGRERLAASHHTDLSVTHDWGLSLSSQPSARHPFWLSAALPRRHSARALCSGGHGRPRSVCQPGGRTVAARGMMTSRQEPAARSDSSAPSGRSGKNASRLAPRGGLGGRRPRAGGAPPSAAPMAGWVTEGEAQGAERGAAAALCAGFAKVGRRSKRRTSPVRSHRCPGRRPQ